MTEAIHLPTERVRTMDAKHLTSSIDSNYAEIDCRHWLEIISEISPSREEN